MLHTRDDDEKIRHVVVGEACLGKIPISPEEAGGGLPMNIINEIAIMPDARHSNLVSITARG
jgi:hypothetical protein